MPGGGLAVNDLEVPHPGGPELAAMVRQPDFAAAALRRWLVDSVFSFWCPSSL